MIYIKQTSDGQDLQVTKDTWTNVSPLWSPDDQRIAFVSQRADQPGIYVTPTLGGPVTLLKQTDGVNISLRHWARDGSSIFYDQAGNLFRLDLGSRDTVKLTDLPEIAGVSNRFFALSPDESQIVFCDTRDGQKDIWTMPVEGGEALRVTNDADNERRPLWHPDGDRIIYNVLKNGLIQIKIVAAYGNGQTTQVTRGEGKYSLISLSPKGDRIYYSTAEPRSDIARVDVETGREEEVAAQAETEFWSDVSPDGRSTVYETNSSPNPTGNISGSSLVLKSSDGQSRVLPNKGFDATWLPDSRHIAVFRQNETNNNDYDTWIVDTVTGSEELITTDRVMPPAFSVMPITRVDIGVMDFSPDGERVATSTSRSRKTL
jgi:Tol biopolymer transport system component